MDSRRRKRRAIATRNVEQIEAVSEDMDDYLAAVDVALAEDRRTARQLADAREEFKRVCGERLVLQE